MMYQAKITDNETRQKYYMKITDAPHEYKK